MHGLHNPLARRRGRGGGAINHPPPFVSLTMAPHIALPVRRCVLACAKVVQRNGHRKSHSPLKRSQAQVAVSLVCMGPDHMESHGIFFVFWQESHFRMMFFLPFAFTYLLVGADLDVRTDLGDEPDSARLTVLF